MTRFIEDFLQWLLLHETDLWVNLIAGLTAALIILFMQTAVLVISATIHDLIFSKLRLRRMVGFKLQGDPIFVLSGSLDVQTPLLQGPDARAAARIQTLLEQAYQRRSVTDSFRCNPDDENIPQADFCTIGGPEFNACTRSVLSYLSKYVAFDENGKLVIPTTQKEYSTQYSGTKVVSDYGFLARIINPIDQRYSCVVVAGCDTYGVYAAAQLLTERGRFPSLWSQFKKRRGTANHLLNKDFIAIVSCRVQGTDIAEVKIEEIVTIH